VDRLMMEIYHIQGEDVDKRGAAQEVEVVKSCGRFALRLAETVTRYQEVGAVARGQPPLTHQTMCESMAEAKKSQLGPGVASALWLVKQSQKGLRKGYLSHFKPLSQCHLADTITMIIKLSP